jgi:hypothetical protein
MAAGDTLTSFTDLGVSPVDPTLYDQYFGLVDTGLGFTGSSTMQDVQLGSPVPLDTATSAPYSASVTDLLPQVPTTTYNPTLADMSQMLSGASDVPPNNVAATFQTNTPNVTDVNSLSSAAISGLSKFGSALASLFGGAPRQQIPIGSRGYAYSGASLAPTSAVNSGSFTLATVIIITALIFLLLRSE